MVGLPTSSTASTAIWSSACGRQLLQAHVADDVLHHDDRVVHQDADGEDQREERDAVERVAVEVEDQQREAERHGDGQQHDERLAPAEEEQDEQRDAEDREAHVQQQLVGFLAGGGAVVAVTATPTSAGMSVPLSASTLASTAWTTSMALAPGRLAS
jgi:hypothetical protein